MNLVATPQRWPFAVVAIAQAPRATSVKDVINCPFPVTMISLVNANFTLVIIPLQKI